MRYLGILVLVVALFVSTGQALAETVTTGFQHLVIVSASESTAVGVATLCGQELLTDENKAMCTIGTLGLKNGIPGTAVTVEPFVSYVGGWYPGSDAVSIGTAFGVKRGPLAVKLSFEWFSNTAGGYRQHTKFWVHNVSYTAGNWTIGALFQKVDKGEKVAPTLAHKINNHCTIEGRWYRSTNPDPKLHKYVENGRLVLKIT